jgi:murein DD-endopeptidase MepM/ murein hydrolase activator NlpD
MRRDVPLTAAVLLLCIVLLLITMVLYDRANGQRAEIDRLEAELAAVSAESDAGIREGGAETDPPPTQAVSSPYTFPIAETDYLTLTSPYGYRVSPILEVERYHQGIDVAATWRAQVVASADGVVVEHWPPPDGYYRGHEVYGGLVILEHSNGWRTLYAHLSETRVHTGWTIRAGEVIGRVGSTGRSRGAHLHFEIQDAAGEALNPLLYVAPKERS